MTPLNASLLIIFGVIAYMIIVDENVAIYINLVIKMTRLNIERLFWMAKFHPRNPITNLIKKWEYEKLAKELEKEFNLKND